MKTYRVEDIICSFGIFLDDEIEAENYSSRWKGLQKIYDRRNTRNEKDIRRFKKSNRRDKTKKN